MAKGEMKNENPRAKTNSYKMPPKAAFLMRGTGGKDMLFAASDLLVWLLSRIHILQEGAIPCWL